MARIDVYGLFSRCGGIDTVRIYSFYVNRNHCGLSLWQIYCLSNEYLTNTRYTSKLDLFVILVKRKRIR